VDEQTVMQLVAGIASGARELMVAHAAQLQAEVRRETARAVTAGIFAATAVGLALVAALFLLVALVQVLVELLGWPASASWAAVAGLMIVVGLILAAIARQRWTETHLIPIHTLKSMRESWSWIMRPRN
jgi:hypothetical protein